MSSNCFSSCCARLGTAVPAPIRTRRARPFVGVVDLLRGCQDRQVQVHHQLGVTGTRRFHVAGGEDQPAERLAVLAKPGLEQPGDRLLGTGGLVVLALRVVHQVVGPERQLDPVGVVRQVAPFVEVAQAGADVGGAVVLALGRTVGLAQLIEAAFGRGAPRRSQRASQRAWSRCSMFASSREKRVAAAAAEARGGFGCACGRWRTPGPAVRPGAWRWPVRR